MERTAFIHRSIVLATAALTVAVGITVASLGGYLRPAHDRAPPAATVVVPVTRSEPVFASNAEHEPGEHHRHHGREREHEHEDD